MAQHKSLAIYQAPNGAIELPLDAKLETIWASQAQIAQVFGVTPQNITIHLKSIYNEGEMDESSTCKESLQVQKEGRRDIHQISPQALTAITLLVAESDPKDKDKMIGLVLLLLGVDNRR